MFFKKYMDKTDGAIRGFDVKSKRVKIICLLIVLVCLIFSVIAIYPAFWVMVSGFKDIKEFTTEATLFPKVFDFSGFKYTWDKLNFAVYYKNSLIMVVGCVLCAIFFNGFVCICTCYP